MRGLSISFTLGKASIPKQANVEHNNREYIARNIDKSRVQDNITYKKQDVREAYNQLFGKAIEEYNAKQKRKDRMIDDYYQHIADGKREEAFYEAIVQFGDSSTAPCGSLTGEQCQSMLDEYVRNFENRNPNLHLFNAVMHLDEATPHLHLNFIPYYTKGRTNGLSKGVSMKAALDEQGFTANNFKENRLVAWEESERAEMENILNRNGFVRDDKKATYAHMTVEDFKKSQDEKKIISALRKQKNISSDDLQKENVVQLKNKINALERENKILETQKSSPYKSFFYSSPEKQAHVQARLDELGIPYRETENGLEAQECFVEDVRKIEKEFKPQKTTARSKLRDDIDRLLMQSKDIDELLNKLESEHYSVKRGKYISVKPANGGQYIRLKSLGENYSEYALRNRINARKKYEGNVQSRINNIASKDSIEFIVMRTMQFYIIAFQRNALPMKKRDVKKPFSWTNDKELDKLTALNAKINSGATLETIRRDFNTAENTVTEKENELNKAKADLISFNELKEKIEIVFEGKPSKKFTRQQAEQTLRQYQNITKSNYHNVDILISNEQESIEKIQAELDEARETLSECSDELATMEKVMGGTYVQSLVGEERERREANVLPNGLKNA